MLAKEKWYDNLKNKKSQLLYERLMSLYSENSILLNETQKFDSILNQFANIVQASKRSSAEKVADMKAYIGKFVDVSGGSAENSLFKNLPTSEQKTLSDLDNWFKTASKQDAEKWVNEYQNAIASGVSGKTRKLRTNPDIVKSKTAAPPSGQPKQNNPPTQTPPAAIARTNVEVIKDWINQNKAEIKNIANNATDEKDYINKLSTLMNNSNIKFETKLTKTEARELLDSIISASGEKGVVFKTSALKVIGETLRNQMITDSSGFLAKHYGKILSGFLLLLAYNIDYPTYILSPIEFYRSHKCKHPDSIGQIDRIMCGRIRDDNYDKPWAVVEKTPTEPQQEKPAQPQQEKVEEIKIGDRVKHPRFEEMGCYKVVKVSDDKSRITIAIPASKTQKATTQEVNASSYKKCN